MRSNRKVAIGLAILWLSLTISAFVAIPIYLKSLVRIDPLQADQEMRWAGQESPYSTEVKIYVYNITNPQDVQHGSKPVVQEIGPVVFRPCGGDVNDYALPERYMVKMGGDCYKLRKDLGLNGSEMMTIPHPFVQNIALWTKANSPGLLAVIRKGLEDVFHPKTAFVQATFADIFVEGIYVDCSTGGPEAKTICLNFQEGVVNGATRINSTHFRYALLSGHETISKQNRSLFQKIEGPGVFTSLFFRKENKDACKFCKKPPNDEESLLQRLLVTSTKTFTGLIEMWRLMQPYRKVHLNIEGVPLKRHFMALNELKAPPRECQGSRFKCLPRGLVSLGICNNSSLVISQPHFFKADPELLQDVVGLNPTQQKHSTQIDIETVTGITLAIIQRLQYNLLVEPIREVAVMEKLKTLVMPLFWLEESLILNGATADLVERKIHSFSEFEYYFKLASLLLSLCGLILAGYFVYMGFAHLEVLTI